MTFKKNNKIRFGMIPWIKGKHHTKESNEKNRLSHLGKKHTEEHNKKISIARKGIMCAEETKRKIGLKHKGKKISEEQKLKISNKLKGIKPSMNAFAEKAIRKRVETRKLKNNYICSEITKEKIRASKLGQSMPLKVRLKIKKTCNKESFKQAKRLQRVHQIFPIRDTKIEVKIQDFLKQLGITFFTHQYMKEIKHGYQCDIFVPSLNLIIECDGNYWHKYPIGNEMDKIRTKELIEKGFKVLRLWEVDINKMNMEDFNKKIGGEKIGGFT